MVKIKTMFNPKAINTVSQVITSQRRTMLDVRNYRNLLSVNKDYYNTLKIQFIRHDNTSETIILDGDKCMDNNKPLTESKIIEKLNKLKTKFVAKNYKIIKLKYKL